MDRMNFRVGTWNCRQYLHRSINAIDELGCDILVVQECGENVVRSFDGSAQWKGLLPAKGHAVLTTRDWKLELVDDWQPWVLPVRAVRESDGFALTVLGVWTVKRPGFPSYQHQFAATIDRYEEVLRAGPVVLAGDLNASAQLTTSRVQHEANLTRLENLGLRSAFHHHHQRAHGAELDMTLRWIGPGSTPYQFHCDFIFLTADLQEQVRAVEVGGMPVWVDSKRSDHCPVVVDLGSGPTDCVR